MYNYIEEKLYPSPVSATAADVIVKMYLRRKDSSFMMKLHLKKK